MTTDGRVSVWVQEAISERVHVVHVVGSVVDLLQEVLQLLDEDALLEPLNTEAQQMSAVRGFTSLQEPLGASGPTWLPP